MYADIKICQSIMEEPICQQLPELIIDIFKRNNADLLLAEDEEILQAANAFTNIYLREKNIYYCDYMTWHIQKYILAETRRTNQA